VPTHSVQRTEWAAGQLFKFHHKGPVANLSNVNPMDYRVWGEMLEAYSKLKTKPKTIAEFKKAL